MRRSRRREEEDEPISLFSFQDIVTTLTGIMIVLVLFMVLQTGLGNPVETPSEPEGSPAASLAERLQTLRTELETVPEPPLFEVRDLEERIAGERSRKEALELEQTLSRSANSALFRAREAAIVHGSKRMALLHDLRRQRDELKAEAARQAAEKKVFFIPDRTASKRPVVIELARAGLRVTTMTREGGVESFVDEEAASSVQAAIRRLFQWLGRRDRSAESVVVFIKPSAAAFVVEEVIKPLGTAGWDYGYEPLDEDRHIEIRPEGK